MPAARLTQIRLRNFKSIGPEEQTVDLKPLTVLIGRNNSGKSTVIQSLLLLKQTLEDPRPEVQLALQGNYVRATSLRELTHGWPEDMTDKGPEITLLWDSALDVSRSYKTIKFLLERQNGGAIFKKMFAGTPAAWISAITSPNYFRQSGPAFSEMSLCFRAMGAAVVVKGVELRSRWADPKTTPVPMQAIWRNGSRELTWEGASRIAVIGDHFIPHIAPYQPDYEKVPDALVHAFELLYEPRLDVLRLLLSNIGYVSAVREEVPPYYPRPTITPTKNMLPNGGNATELLYGRRGDVVHCVTMDEHKSSDERFRLPDKVVSQSLRDAVNGVLWSLGVESNISFADVQELGLFRMLFGRAPSNHVGRGVGHILPIIVAAQLSDPMLGQELDPDITLSDYLDGCTYSPILALEELESHLHPKAQTRLAHFLVALARSGRQIIVETHSDHLVRRLRGLVARSEPGSETERWLIENINIVEVDQTREGVTHLHQTQITREGSIEKWPADFMDESSDEERAIYFAAMEKSPPEAPPADESFFTDVPVDGKAE